MEEEIQDSSHAKNDQQNQDLRESKYADNVEFWRVHSDIDQLLTDIQIAIIQRILIIWFSMIKRTKLHLCRYQLLMVTAKEKSLNRECQELL